MAAKVRALPGLLGAVAMLAALTQVGGSARQPVSVARAGAPTPTPAVGTVDSEAYVKYVVVTADTAGPEGLTTIADRLLGDTSRAEELYQLNVGRRQTDGQALTDRRQLRAGWALVLPWDAVGDGVRVGPLPTQPPTAPSTSGGTAPGAPGCAPPASTVPGPDWASPRRAWERTRGAGVLVAIVDSGVDGSRPELRGRVGAGVDIPSGGDRGDVDCLGSGTAMASAVGAGPAAGVTPTGPDATAGTGPVGMAPEATILPLRIVSDTPRSKPADAATAIEVAASAGAGVIALGAFVDLTDPLVSAAVNAASDHDIVVVAAAPAGTGDPAAPTFDAPIGLLRVGEVGAPGQPAAGDVLAPGAGAATGDVGPRYEVALVAGTAALIRSAFPDLGAAQVVQRVRETADRAAGAEPGAPGVLNPDAAVTAPVGAAAPDPDRGGNSNALRVLTIALLVVLGIASLTLLARRGTARRGPADVPGRVPAVGSVAVAGTAGAGSPAGADRDSSARPDAAGAPGPGPAAPRR